MSSRRRTKANTTLQWVAYTSLINEHGVQSFACALDVTDTAAFPPMQFSRVKSFTLECDDIPI
jgi:hypothetical protein